MGKHGKKQKHINQRRGRDSSYYLADEEDVEQLSSSASRLVISDTENDSKEEDDNEEGENQMDDDNGCNSLTGDIPSKFWLYQQSVQSPKGDISYLQKFFLMYVGGRVPLHFQEDFCGTALLSMEWLHGDPRRTAVGLDLDLEALNWCTQNNMDKIGAGDYSQISLFHGNVLQPLEARLVKIDQHDLLKTTKLLSSKRHLGDATIQGSPGACTNDKLMKDIPLPARDIICAFNFSCCCLQSRKELVSYFKHALNSLSRKGGILVMDLYGGTSSECNLRMQRRFPNFTYVWEQAGFDIIQRKTRISLHFVLHKQKKKLRHAFSYNWRLWSLPEVKDCLDEAGFQAVHFWIRQMPDSKEIQNTEDFGTARDVKFEEVTNFQQQDSWNAYIVAVV